MKQASWVFVVDDIGSSRRLHADTLVVTDAGWLKFWLRKKLCGVVKSWTRVYLDASQNVPTKEA